MTSTVDSRSLQLKLFMSLEPRDVCQTLSEIVESFASVKAVAVAFFDPDFECFSEAHRYAFGAAAAQVLQLVDEMPADEVSWNSGSYRLAAAGQLEPVFAKPFVLEDVPVALLVVAGAADLTEEQLNEKLARFTIEGALANVYEVTELRHEVERLRQQYDQLEQELDEERRVQAISGVSEKGHEARFAIERSDKERLVYEISNSVRSSLDIQEVLQTAVTRIGDTFELSRCLVIWPTPDGEEFTTYEYHGPGVQASKDLLSSAAGKAFVKHAGTKTAPQEFSAGHMQSGFDHKFIESFGFKSALLVPLMYQDRNVGSLFLQDCKSTPREWTIDRTALIGSLADLVTVAIEHANMHEEKKRQAVTDGLTGIANRRHFNDTLTKEFERAKRYNNKLSLVLVDLDFLKKINDTHGHHVGDEAIKSIGSILNKSCRAVDLAARYGGEEFCLLLPDTDSGDARNLAERIRSRIEHTEVEGAGKITASIGVATYPQHGAGPEDLFQAADAALYAAKTGGRNRVSVAGSS